MKIQLEFKKEDCWIGFFWKTKKFYNPHAGMYKPNGTPVIRVEYTRDIWICIVPMLPIHITQKWE